MGDVTGNSLQDDATIKCWGRNANGELGQGDTKDRGDGSRKGSECPNTTHPRLRRNITVGGEWGVLTLLP